MKYLMIITIIVIVLLQVINCQQQWVSIEYYNNNNCDQLNTINYQLESTCVASQVFTCNQEQQQIEWYIYSTVNCTAGTKVGMKSLPFTPNNETCNSSGEIYKCLSELPNLKPLVNNFVSTVFYTGSNCYGFNLNDLSNLLSIQSTPTNQCDFDGYFGTFTTCNSTLLTKQRYESSFECNATQPTNTLSYPLPLTTCSYENTGIHVSQFCNQPN